MRTIDITAIILAVINLLSTCGWFVAGRKHRQEVESLEARVNELTNEVNRLKDAIEKVNDCPYRDNCPVRRKRVWGEPERDDAQ